MKPKINISLNLNDLFQSQKPPTDWATSHKNYHEEWDMLFTRCQKQPGATCLNIALIGNSNVGKTALMN
jgi:GTP-binding protein EngB required for normal cell division